MQALKFRDVLPESPLGRFLVQWLERHSIGQYQFAKHIVGSPTQVSSWCNGLTVPSAPSIIRMARVMSIIELEEFGRVRDVRAVRERELRMRLTLLDLIEQMMQKADIHVRPTRGSRCKDLPALDGVYLEQVS